jgi:group I intron endonuclease
MPVIYKTTNLIDGKIYVGQDKYNRNSYLGSGTWICNVIKKYGKENFRKEILEHCSLEELNDKEQYWIKELDSMNPGIGYNLTAGGKHLAIVSEIVRAHISEARKNMSPEAKSNMSIAISKALTGKKFSEERKKNISDGHKGQIPWNKGKVGVQEAWNKGIPVTEEVKIKISKSNKGKVRTADVKKRISESLKGRKKCRKTNTRPPLTEEHKRKISESLRNKKRSKNLQDIPSNS